MNDLLIVFVKYPQPGRVKCRLAAAIGDHAAADAYRAMVTLIMERTAPPVPQAYECAVYADPGASLEQYRCWLAGPELLVLQQGDTLGERMRTAFLRSFTEGYRKVVLIGSDCPEISVALVQDAFRRLDACDVVLGPAEDGGYYLIALKRDIESVFCGIDWGTTRVMEQTLARLGAGLLSWELLSVLRDVDRIDDLDYYRQRGFEL